MRRRLGYCFIEPSAFECMRAEAAAHAPFETGGVLLGVADNQSVWVDVVIGPGPDAIHRKSSFEPDSVFQQAEISRAYETHGRRIGYLGDWHTHPGAPAYLSRTDEMTLRAISRHRPARQPRPIMTVLGGGKPWEVIVWRFRKTAIGISVAEPLQIVMTD